MPAQLMVDLSTHFLPELVLTLGILVVLVYDMWVRGKNAQQGTLALVTLVLSIGATLWLYGQPPHATFGLGPAAEPIRAGAFVSDGFTEFFRLISLVTTLLVLLSGLAYFRDRTPFKGEFYALLLCAALAMNLMAGANDLLVIALSIEFLSIVSYIMTAYLKGDKLSAEGGLKYFLYGSVAGAIMLYGLSILYGVTGSLSLPAVAATLADPQRMLVGGATALVLPALTMVLVGMAFKVALVPFHQWSPDAYHGAPTPVTAFLSVGPKAAGFAVLLRFLLVAFDTPTLSQAWMGTLSMLAILTMILGNVVALSQTNVKRMMAYSSIAQAGYMLVGLISLGGGRLTGIEPVGSLLLYILAYLFTNLGAFAVIIAVDHATGSSELGAFSGLMRRSPLLAVSLFIFFLSLVGIPPLAGFLGKFAVFSSAIASGQGTLALVGVLTGVVAVGYYFKVVREMFFVDPAEGAAPIRASQGVTFVVAVCLVMTVVVGIAAEPFIRTANDAAAVITPVQADSQGESAALP